MYKHKLKIFTCFMLLMFLLLGCASHPTNKATSPKNNVRLFHKRVDVVVTDVKYIRRLYWHYTLVKAYNKQYKLEVSQEFKGTLRVEKGEIMEATLYSRMINNKIRKRWLGDLRFK